MDVIKPTVQIEMELDQRGVAYEAEAVRIYQLIKDKPRQNRYIVHDGYVSAMYAENKLLIYEEYKGTDGKFYERLRSTTEFEAHLLRKIDGLSSFFVER